MERTYTKKEVQTMFNTAFELVTAKEPGIEQPDVDFKTAKPVEDKAQWDAVCSDCGNKCTVPFKPNPTWEVRCPECFKKKKEGF